MSDEMTGGEGRADIAYRWTIRSLYAVAIALNVWVLWDQLADETEQAELKAKVEKWKNKILRPLHLEQQIQRETGPMIWEAMKIVEESEDGSR